MYSKIAKHILYPIGESLLGTSMLKHLKTLEETQWWPSERLRELQNEKLRALIKHAYINVPYYRRVFEEGSLTDKDIQTVEDLQKLPILTKNDIRQNFSNLMSKDIKHRQSILNSTAGSTGEPLRFYLDMDCVSVAWASTFRAWEWAGYELGDKRATLGGSSLVPRTPPPFKQRLRDMAERNLKLSAFDMDEQAMGAYAQKLTSYRPKFLRGYASAMYTFACYLRTTGINNIRPKAVFATAEMLLPEHREIIERQFGCRVFDNYGCYDGGANACECDKHQGHHLAVEKAIAEFTCDSTPVPTGKGDEILLTDLHNYAMPFIRYAVGDMGIISQEECSCGRGLPLIETIQGRVSDFIITPEGTKIHGEFFSHIFWEMTSFMQFQIVQESQDSLVINVVPFPTADPSKINEEARKIEDTLCLRTGRMAIKVEQVEKIHITKAGKYKFIIPLGEKV